MKNILTLLLIITTSIVFARYHGGHSGHGHRPPPPPPMHHHHHHTGWAIGSGILGGAIIANTIYDSSRVTPVVINQPVRVWVEGRYIDQIQPNGFIARIWIPGHWEYR